MPELSPLLWIAAASLAIGAMVGATGIGGFLIISVLVHFSDMPVRTAMGTALVIAAANGALGAWLFQRRGNIDWSVALPMVAGAMFFALLGGWLNRWLPVALVIATLGCIMIGGSLSSLWKSRVREGAPVDPAPASGGNDGRTGRTALLALIGCVSGLAAGLTGAGGPLLSVPLLAILSYPVLAAVGASQVLQLTASLAGSLPYWERGLVAVDVLVLLVPLHLAGIALGVRLVHALNRQFATRVVAVLGVAAGAGILKLALS